MLDIPARTVYVDGEVRRRPNCRARLERLLPHVRCGDIRNLDAEAYEALWRMPKRRHGKDDFGDEAVVAFTAFDEGRRDWYYHLRRDDQDYRTTGAYCQRGIELNIVDGCVFRCAYCGFGRRIIFSLDVEAFMQGLDGVFAGAPGQTLYKYSNMTDLPPFEPEYGAVRPMVERFARDPRRYLMLFTKSDAVEFLLDLDHGGHTIISWSLTLETASRAFDKRTATLGERLSAMRKAEAAGYRVRARLSPIVPVRGWREEYASLLERLFSAARPDIVTLELLGWMDYEDLVRILPPDLLDPAMLEAARAAADALRGDRSGPFPESTHQEIYRFCVETVRRLSPRTPVAVCHGTPETWEALGPLMGMTPDRYICNCGPTSAPGDAIYDRAWGGGRTAGGRGGE
jgi:hypothetical protein